MKYYHNLPFEIVRLTKTFDHKLLAPQTEKHDWRAVWTSRFLTEEGIKWFSDRGFFIREAVQLHRVPGNTEGPIHTDTVHPDQIQYAFNFVINGQGIMEWVTDIEGNKNTVIHNTKDYDQYFSVKSFKVVESWNGTAAMVRLNAPHRIVGYTDRFTASLRLHPPSPKTFEEALDILINY